MKRRTLVAVVAIVAIAVGWIIFVATSPHPGIGRVLCEIRGGEWVDGFSGPRDEIVTSGSTCVRS